MLIYYRFNNFCSFNCESEFSMSAPTGKVKKRFPDNYVETAEGFDLLWYLQNLFSNLLSKTAGRGTQHSKRQKRESLTVPVP